MESSLKKCKPENPVMDPMGQEISRSYENCNPNVSYSSPARISVSTLRKSSKSSKSVQKSANSNLKAYPSQVFSSRSRIRERKFLVVKKNSGKEQKNLVSVESTVAEMNCRCGAKTNGNMKKCVCVAYETLRDSQEDFCKNRRESEVEITESSQNVEDVDEIGGGESGESDQIEVSLMKRRREMVLEEARRSLPEYGKVMHLVQAFEKLTCFPLSKAKEEKEMDKKFKKAMKWGLPGMSEQQKLQETERDQVSWGSSLCSSDLVLTATNLGLESYALVSSSWNGSPSSVTSQSLNGGRRSRRNSLDSSTTMGSTRSKKKQIQVTSLKPFKLRTEQRGRMKEEEFAKKLQEMIMEEEKMRIPIAQALPWTTDEPECLIKPHVKDITIPLDLKLHSDIRAVERAEFDSQVAEKTSLTEQYKTERKRLQKLAEEEEIRRLRRELIPKAQPMPYFDRPFIPRRSSKQPTVPRDPKFNTPQQNRTRWCSLSSWSETGSYITDLFYQQDL